MERYAKAAGAIGVLLVATGIACQKRTAVLPPPAAPKVEVAQAPQPKPVPNPPTIATFVAEPSKIEAGRSAMLHWVVKDATQIEIDHGIGSIAATGQQTVSPTEDTTYTIHASGPGGEASASTALAVELAPPKPEAPRPTISERLSKDVQDVYFDFDRSAIRADARMALTRDSEALKSILSDFPTYTVIVEGHCDERGSAEYNVALGDRRAKAAKAFLSDLGVSSERLQVISYGKERPQCTESTEECWQKNRRVHFAAGEDQQRRSLGALVGFGSDGASQ